MPKLPRKTVVQFGVSGPSTDFGQFGSKAASAPQTSQDPSVIQQLSAWITGWTLAAVGAAFNPYLEDMNGAFFVFGYFLANIFERGVPDWDAGTTYYQGAQVQDPGGSGQRWYSLQNSNLNNTPPASASNAFWRWDNPPTNQPGAATLNKVPKVTSTSASNGSPGGVVLGDSQISEDGTDVIIGLPLKFPDNSVQVTAATSVVTAQANLGPGGSNTRGAGTVYHNTGSKPIFVSVVCSGASAGFNVGILGITDSSAAPTTQVNVQSVGVSGQTTVASLSCFFIVLPGNYYKVTLQNSSLTSWFEWS